MKFSDYPVKINNTSISQEPKSWIMTYNVVENVLTTEAGTDVVDVKRTGKLTISASFDVSSSTLATFETWSTSTSALTVEIYDVVSGNYVSHSMRMRNFTPSYVEHSNNTSETFGLWRVSFDLIEF